MPQPNFDVMAHVAEEGDLHGDAGDYVGTRGKGRAMEGFAITFRSRIDGLGLRYRAAQHGAGDTPWTADGGFAGTRGQQRAVEGFMIELSGPRLADYDVEYMAHVHDRGDTAWVANGAFCGTRGLAVEGLAVRIAPRRRQYVSLISRAASGSGKALLITARPEDGSVRVSVADGSDLQLWDRRPVKGGQGFVLISKARPDLCIARGPDQPIVLKPVSAIDGDDNCVWRNDTVPGEYNAINSWTDWELKLNLAGNPPYAERDSRLLAYRWAGGANNELWRQSRTRYNVVAGTDATALDALAKAIYDGCPALFNSSLRIDQMGIVAVGYRMLTAPRFDLRPSEAFRAETRQRFTQLLGAAGPQAARQSAGAAASTVSVVVDALQLHLQRQGQPDLDALDTSLQMAAAVQINPDRSLRLQLVWGKIAITQHPELDDLLNQWFVPALLDFLNRNLLAPIAIPAIELLGVDFTAPALATQHPHLLAATAQLPDTVELPPATAWPQGKVFAGADENVLNAVAAAALERVVPSGTWDYSIDIGVCTLGVGAQYGVYLRNPRFSVTPTSRNVYRLSIELGAHAGFSLSCVLSASPGASARGWVTATAEVSVDARNHIIVRLKSVEQLSLSWGFDDTPFWLPNWAISPILKAFEPAVAAVVSAALRDLSFDVYSIPTISATIAGRTFDLTLRDLALDSTADGAGKPLLLATGAAAVTMR